MVDFWIVFFHSELFKLIIRENNDKVVHKSTMRFFQKVNYWCTLLAVVVVDIVRDNIFN